MNSTLSSATKVVLLEVITTLNWKVLKQSSKFIGCSLLLFWVSGCANLSIEQSTPDESENQESIQTQSKDVAEESITNEITQTDITKSAITLSPYRLKDEQIDPANKIKFQNGVSAIKNRDFLKAQSLFENIVLTHPNHSGAKLNLALALSGQEQYQAAIEMLNLAIINNPNNIHALNQLAILQRQQGQFEQAKQHWLDALTKWPDYPQAHYNLGILYDLYLGQFDLALSHYQQYQSYLEKPDRLVKAWVADLERRINSQATSQ
jgi:tetratricopeptide (TPR) repeat protein